MSTRDRSDRFSTLDQISHAVRSGNPGLVGKQLADLKDAVYGDREGIASVDKEAFTPNAIFDSQLMRAFWLISSAEYLRGNFEEARKYSKRPADRIRDQVLTSKTRLKDSASRKLADRQVRLVIEEAAACIRQGEIERAQDLLDRSTSFLRTCLQSSEFRCYENRSLVKYCRGLLARNSGDFPPAHRFFHEAAGLAVAHCEETLAREGISAADRESEQLFKKRYLARIQAFGFGLSYLGEGKLLSARASFYFALGLLENPSAKWTQIPAFYDEVMSRQIRLWLVVVAAMLVPFSEEGRKELGNLALELDNLGPQFANSRGHFTPHRLLFGAVKRLTEIRMLQAAPTREAAAQRLSAPQTLGNSSTVAVPSIADLWPEPLPKGSESDITPLITRAIRAWVTLHVAPATAFRQIDEKSRSKVTIAFWRNELYIADAEAELENHILNYKKKVLDPRKSRESVLKFVESLDAEQFNEFTSWQRVLVDVLKGRSYMLLSETCDGSEVDGKLLASKHHWDRQAGFIGKRLKPLRPLSGIICAKIDDLPLSPIPQRLPMPYEVGYPHASFHVYRLIAGHNAIVEFIRTAPGELPKEEMKRLFLDKTGFTPDTAREYCVAFPDLAPWLMLGGTPPDRWRMSQPLLDEYLRYLERPGVLAAKPVGDLTT